MRREMVLPLIVVILMAMMANFALAEDLENICPNGDFEVLSPVGNNFPVNWGAGAPGIVIDKDAHGGSIAVRLSATEGEYAILNSVALPAKVGKLSFWYKAISSSSSGNNLRMFLIVLLVAEATFCLPNTLCSKVCLTASS